MQPNSNFISGTGLTKTAGHFNIWVAVADMVSPMHKSDPELLPIHRPRCPKCQMRMRTTEIAPGPDGFENRTFECLRCNHRATMLVVADPLKGDAVKWASSELRPPE